MKRGHQYGEWTTMVCPEGCSQYRRKGLGMDRRDREGVGTWNVVGAFFCFFHAFLYIGKGEGQGVYYKTGKLQIERRWETTLFCIFLSSNFSFSRNLI